MRVTFRLRKLSLLFKLFFLNKTEKQKQKKGKQLNIVYNASLTRTWYLKIALSKGCWVSDSLRSETFLLCCTSRTIRYSPR